MWICEWHLSNVLYSLVFPSGVFVLLTGSPLNVTVLGCGQPLFYCAIMSYALWRREREQKDDPILANQIIGNHMANTLAWLQFVSLSPLPLSRLVSSHLVFPPHELLRSLIMTRLVSSPLICRISPSFFLSVSPIHSYCLLSSHLVSSLLVLSLLVSSYVISFNLISTYLVSSPLVVSHLISFCLLFLVLSY